MRLRFWKPGLDFLHLRVLLGGAQRLPGGRGSPDPCLPSRYWLYMLNTPKKLCLPRCCASPEFSYSLTLREEGSGSPVRAFYCWVSTKHAVSPQVLRLPRIFLFLTITRLPRNAVTPQFLCASQKIYFKHFEKSWKLIAFYSSLRKLS